MPERDENAAVGEDFVRYPGLEYHAVSWLYECWGDRCLSAKTEPNRERVAQLKDKIPSVRRGASRVTGSGKPESPPHELVSHQYPVTKRAVDELFEQVKNGRVWSKDMLERACCKYRIDLKNGEKFDVARPLFVLPGDLVYYEGKNGDSLEQEQEEKKREKIRPFALAQKLTADVFGVTRRAVEERVSKTRHYDRFHREPSEAQLYLVAMFLLIARLDGREPELLRILDVLFRSGYEVKAIYHLARYVSSMSDEDRDSPWWRARPELNTDQVDRVIGVLDQT